MTTGKAAETRRKGEEGPEKKVKGDRVRQKQEMKSEFKSVIKRMKACECLISQSSLSARRGFNRARISFGSERASERARRRASKLASSAFVSFIPQRRQRPEEDPSVKLIGHLALSQPRGRAGAEWRERENVTTKTRRPQRRFRSFEEPTQHRQSLGRPLRKQNVPASLNEVFEHVCEVL